MYRFVILAIAIVGFGSTGTAAFAAEPVHDTLTGTGSGAAPAGTICDFDYEFDFDVTINRKRFFDENGALVRRLNTTEERLVHRNADTGYELVEVVHYTTDLDVVTGIVRLTGNSWHLRTTDGELVLVRSGPRDLRPRDGRGDQGDAAGRRRLRERDLPCAGRRSGLVGRLRV